MPGVAESLGMLGAFLRETPSLSCPLPVRLLHEVDLIGWNGIALAEELEMVDERLHALLHRGTRWRHKLVVVNTNSTFGDLVQTLRECQGCTAWYLLINSRGL